jgi:D-arabinose 1-dehydrogenase-like Zn-dependent alcohol dehydrogenase
MDAVKGQFELIIDTVPYAHDINPYMPTLTLDGTLVFVGLLGDIEPAVSTLPMILGRRSVSVRVSAALPKRRRCSISAVSTISRRIQR